jgi:hypothetical protein
MTRPKNGKSKFTPALADKIVAGMKKGMFKVHIAASCGISAHTLTNWTQRGEEALEIMGRGEYVKQSEEALAQLTIRMHEAEQEFIDAHVRRIDMASSRPVFKKDKAGEVLKDAEGKPILDKIIGDWRAGAWLLERMYPLKFGMRQTFEHTGSMNMAASISLAGVSDDDLRKKIEAQDALLKKLKDLDPPKDGADVIPPSDPAKE